MAAHSSNLRQRKGYLRVFQLLSSFISLVLICAAISLHRTDSFAVYEAGTPSLLSLITFGWTLASSIIAIVILRFSDPYPAGVDVGLDFVGWGLGWGFGIVLLQWAAEMNYPSGCEYRDTSNTFCINSRALVACEVVSGIMALLYGYLLLFVMACRALHTDRMTQKQRNKMAEVHDNNELAGLA